MNPDPEQLFEQNQNLVYSILWKKFPAFVTDEDIRQEAMLGLWKSCITWDSTKSKFSTYATTCIINQVYMYFRKQPSTINQVSLSNPVSDTEGLTLEDMIEDPIPSIREEQIAIKDLFKGLSAEERKFIAAKLEGKTQKEIGKLMGISQPTCSRLLARIKVRYERSIQEDD